MNQATVAIRVAAYVAGGSTVLPHNSKEVVHMSPIAVHVITIALVAITLALVYRVREQLVATTNKLQAEIDELKGSS
jgi:hypothetical protein